MVFIWYLLKIKMCKTSISWFKYASRPSYRSMKGEFPPKKLSCLITLHHSSTHPLIFKNLKFMFIPFLKMSPIHHITLSPLRPPLPKPAAPLAGNTTTASSQLLLPMFSWSLGSLKGTFDCRTTPTLLLFPRVVSGNPLLTG